MFKFYVILSKREGLFQQVSLDFFFFSADYCSHRNKTEQRFSLLLGFSSCTFPVLVNFCPEVLKFRNASIITFLLLDVTFYCPISLNLEASRYEFFFLIRPLYSVYIFLEELLRKHVDKHLWAFEGLRFLWKNIENSLLLLFIKILAYEYFQLDI